MNLKAESYEVCIHFLKKELKRKYWRLGGIRQRRFLQKLGIVLVQLRNGLRISEAVAAYNSYTQTKERWQEVKLSKSEKTAKRQGKEFLTRKAYIPECVKDTWGEWHGSLPMMTRWLKKNYGIKTHDLRRKFITFLGSKGISPQIIAKITGHRTMHMILLYTQQYAADDKLADNVLLGV